MLHIADDIFAQQRAVDVLFYDLLEGMGELKVAEACEEGGELVVLGELNPGAFAFLGREHAVALQFPAEALFEEGVGMILDVVRMGSFEVHYLARITSTYLRSKRLR